MSRTRGAKDLHRRKRRKDRVKKYVRRQGKLVPYKSKRSKEDPLKLWFWIVQPMTKEGYRNWGDNVRLKIKRQTYKPYLRVDAHYSRISNPEAIAEFALGVIGHEGVFIMKMFSHAKNKYNVTNRKVAKIEIRMHATGLKAYVSETSRLSHYWFWEG